MKNKFQNYSVNFLFLIKKDYVEKWGVLAQFANYYTQIEGIGAGKYAKVFSVRRHTDNKKFAVKVYDTNKIFRENFSYYILYEIMILREMNEILNTNCLKLYRIYEGLNYVYCVTELYRGGELLEALIREGAISEYASLKIIRKILIGLEY